MKYIIYPVWAHRVSLMHPERGPRHAIVYERLARSFSIDDGTDLLAHTKEADRLQKEYDEACEPIRVYVFESNPGQKFVPVYAGRQRVPSGHYFKQWRIEGTWTGRFSAQQQNESNQPSA